jgi:hypothetical protein
MPRAQSVQPAAAPHQALDFIDRRRFVHDVGGVLDVANQFSMSQVLADPS